jgi:DNA-binding NarL/FixJ family response regulator
VTPLTGLNRLTVREVEVLQLLAQGRSNEEIASSLHLSESTVKTHIARALTKLDARDRIHLAVLAHRHGLV